LAVVDALAGSSTADEQINVSALIVFATRLMTVGTDQTKLTVQMRKVPDAELAVIVAKTTSNVYLVINSDSE
jgi:hypothetical protein